MESLKNKMKTSSKQSLSFVYDGKEYRGHIISSTTLQPHFHWFMFDDGWAIAQYGDSIAFKVDNGKLIPLYHLTAPDFVQAVKQCVEQHILK